VAPASPALTSSPAHPGVVLTTANGTGPVYKGQPLTVQLLPTGDDPANNASAAGGVLFALDAACKWGAVCVDPNERPTLAEAQAVCAALGWTGSAKLGEYDRQFIAMWSPADELNVSWSKLSCPANDARLAACLHIDANTDAWCNGVECHGVVPDACPSGKAYRIYCREDPGEEGDVRLLPANGYYEGASNSTAPLQLFHNGFWQDVAIALGENYQGAGVFAGRSAGR